MPPPAPASLLAGLVARIRCRKAAVPELAGQPWQVGGLPRASGGRAAAAGAAARGCAEGLPIRRCYFGLCPPRPFTPNPVPDPAPSFPKEGLWGFFSIQLESTVLGSARSPRSRSLVRGVCHGLPVLPASKIRCWLGLSQPWRRRAFGAGLTAVAELARAACA